MAMFSIAMHCISDQINFQGGKIKDDKRGCSRLMVNLTVNCLLRNIIHTITDLRGKEKEKEKLGINMFLLQKLDFQKVQMFCLLHIKSKNKQVKCISEIQESYVLSHILRKETKR